jgi:hypothetical protein
MADIGEAWLCSGMFSGLFIEVDCPGSGFGGGLNRLPRDDEGECVAGIALPLNIAVLRDRCGEIDASFANDVVD